MLAQGCILWSAVLSIGAAAQDKIGQSNGPTLTGATKTDAVRFYDAKGVHLGQAVNHEHR